jgi:beta-phosphoglucomutase-like phosphatase (HAD superfamily)
MHFQSRSKIAVDRDGTLVGTCNANLQSYSKALGDFSLPTPTPLRDLLHQGFAWTEIAKEIFPSLSPITVKEIHLRKAIYFPEFFELLNWNEELLKLIEDQEWALVSNGSEKSSGQILNQRPELKPIKTIGPTSTLRPKPAPDMYIHLMKELDYTPSEILVFEDSETGITSAKLAGLQVIQVDHRC